MIQIRHTDHAALTIVAARAAMAAGHLTACGWIEACLDRIALYEPAVCAMVAMDPSAARSTADAANRAGRRHSLRRAGRAGYGRPACRAAKARP